MPVHMYIVMPISIHQSPRSLKGYPGAYNLRQPIWDLGSHSSVCEENQVSSVFEELGAYRPGAYTSRTTDFVPRGALTRSQEKIL